MNSPENKYDVLSDVVNVDERFNELIQQHKLPKTSIASNHEDVMVNSVNEINSEVFEHIGKMTLITPKDISKLKSAQAFLLSTYTDVPQFRSLTDKVTGVLGNFPTADGKWWQCKKEAEVHFNELQRELFKLERAHIDVEEIDYKIEGINNLLENDVHDNIESKLDPELVKFDLRRLELKRKQYLFEMKQLEKTIKHRIKEVTDWYDVAQRIEHLVKDKSDPESTAVEMKYAGLLYAYDKSDNEDRKAKIQKQIQEMRDIFGHEDAYHRAQDAVNKYIENEST